MTEAIAWRSGKAADWYSDLSFAVVINILMNFLGRPFFGGLQLTPAGGFVEDFLLYFEF